MFYILAQTDLLSFELKEIYILIFIWNIFRNVWGKPSLDGIEHSISHRISNLFRFSQMVIENVLHTQEGMPVGHDGVLQVPAILII